MSKLLAWPAAPAAWPTPLWRRATALVLRKAGRALDRLGRRLSAHTVRTTGEDPVLEFYAEAGAPEGALFINGQRVGVLPGVTRL
jgi:hypothetical protein